MTISPAAIGRARDGNQKATSAKTRREGTSLPVFALVATLASGASFYLAGGHALLHKNTASTSTDAETAFSQNRFTLGDVSTRIDTGRGTPVFVIRGDIKASERGGIIPNLNIKFIDEETGQGVTYSIPRGELLQANESLGFTTRIPAGTFAGSEPTITLEGSSAQNARSQKQGH